jgi:membrane protein implicated in regulation of membrane protease activity
MMKIFILIAVAIIIFLVGQNLFLVVAELFLLPIGVTLSAGSVLPAITNSLALVASIVWSIWYYKRHISKKKESDVTESSDSSDKKSRVYDRADLAMVAEELKSGKKDEALWLQAKIDADKTGKDVEVVYTEYRLRERELKRQQQWARWEEIWDRDWYKLPFRVRRKINRDQKKKGARPGKREYPY